MQVKSHHMEAKAADAVMLMEELRVKIESEEYEWYETKLSVTVSIGIASSSPRESRP